jgi:N-dimethylarginine dimethylaminohydrolase
LSDAVVRLVRQASQLPELSSLLPIERPNRVLMAEPEFFEIESVDNPHMVGRVGSVDRFAARVQWKRLCEAYQETGTRPDITPGIPFCPDYVFCANQALPVPPGLLGPGPAAVASIMRTARRQAEVRPICEHLQAQGVEVRQLDPYSVPRFEGTGDAQWHPTRGLLLGGVGPRSALQAYERISAWTGAPAVVFSLVDPRFYHLDTCLAVVDERTALAFPGAFDAEGLALLRAIFEDLIEVSEVEAMRMVCNGHSPDGASFIVQSGAPEACKLLDERGVRVLEVETAEFLKSGGSVFCMKLHHWA